MYVVCMEYVCRNDFKCNEFDMTHAHPIEKSSRNAVMLKLNSSNVKKLQQEGKRIYFVGTISTLEM